MDVLNSILGNKPLLVPIVAWCVAQVLKLLVSLIKDRRLDIGLLVSTGGMPSSHATLVCALATSVAIVYGAGSAAFAIAAIFALIVMSDATGVRQTVGAQSTILNRILDELFKGKPEVGEQVREIIGHTHLEVTAGALLGILLGWLLT